MSHAPLFRLRDVLSPESRKADSNFASSRVKSDRSGFHFHPSDLVVPTSYTSTRLQDSTTTTTSPPHPHSSYRTFRRRFDETDFENSRCWCWRSNRRNKRDTQRERYCRVAVFSCGNERSRRRRSRDDEECTISQLSTSLSSPSLSHSKHKLTNLKHPIDSFYY